MVKGIVNKEPGKNFSGRFQADRLFVGRNFWWNRRVLDESPISTLRQQLDDMEIVEDVGGGHEIFIPKGSFQRGE